MPARRPADKPNLSAIAFRLREAMSLGVPVRITTRAGTTITGAVASLAIDRTDRRDFKALASPDTSTLIASIGGQSVRVEHITDGVLLRAQPREEA